jgi:hypothetical protein
MNEGHGDVGRGSHCGGNRADRQQHPNEMPREMLFHKKLLTDKTLGV